MHACSDATFMSVVVDLDVMNKRESEGVSTDMEWEWFRKFLMRHKRSLDVSELVTDASFVVQKLVKDVKGIYSFNLFLNALT